MNRLSLLDLFSGIGGFAKGFTDAGFHFDKHYFSEIDKYAESIYRRQFPGAIRCGDVTEIGNDLEKIDIITGGFPCQSFSIAGNRGGFNDTRGTLFFEIERLARQYKPTYMVLENVKGLFSHDRGNTIRTVLDRIRRLDYTVQLLLLNTLDFGIPQNRERAIFICTARGFGTPEISYIRRRKGKVTQCTNSILSNYGNGIDNHGMRTVVGTLRRYKDGEGFREMQSGICPTINSRARQDGGIHPVVIIPANGRRTTDHKYQYHFPCLQPSAQAKNSDNNPIIIQDVLRTDKKQNGKGYKTGEAYTVTSQGEQGLFDGMTLRRLTPRECERLQGFPDDWTKHGVDGETISDTQRYKCIGNAVTVDVIREVSKAIAEVTA